MARWKWPCKGDLSRLILRVELVAAGWGRGGFALNRSAIAGRSPVIPHGHCKKPRIKGHEESNSEPPGRRMRAAWWGVALGLLSVARCAVLGAAGVFRVRLKTPLGIAFEEQEPGAAKGVVVAGLVDDGNAERDGRIWVGDRLVSTSAVVLGGEAALLTVGGGRQYTNWKRQLLRATDMEFDEVIAAIGSNSGRFGYVDVLLEFVHTDKSIPRSASAANRASREGSDVDWDGARGTSVGGVSTPIRPRPDDFDFD